MATVTGLTLAAMEAIRDGAIVGANIVGNDLILTLFDGSTLNAGVAKGTFLSPITGTHAALASSNPTPALGQVIMATDAPKSFRIGDGATAYLGLPEFYTNAGCQYVQTATGLTGIGTAGADWTGLTLTFQADGVTAHKITAKCIGALGEASITVAGGQGILTIYEGATLLDRSDGSQAVSTGVAAKSSIPAAVLVKTFSAGAHTVKVTAARIGGNGNWSFPAGVGFEAKLAVEPFRT